jgi:hypothetical protein
MKPCQSSINQSTQKKKRRGIQEQNERTHQMKAPTFKKTKEPPKRVNYKWNLKLPNPFLSRQMYPIQKGGGSPERRPGREEPSPSTTTHLKIRITCACCKAHLP